MLGQGLLHAAHYKWGTLQAAGKSSEKLAEVPSCLCRRRTPTPAAPPNIWHFELRQRHQPARGANSCIQICSGGRPL